MGMLVEMLHRGVFFNPPQRVVSHEQAEEIIFRKEGGA